MDSIINSYFSKNGNPATGLTPTIRIWEITETTNTLIIGSPDGTMIEIGDGFYKYIFTVANGFDETKRYLIRSNGGLTLSKAERYSIGFTDETKLSQTTIDAIINGTWDETATNHIATGSTGLLLNKISSDTTQIIADCAVKLSLLDLLVKFESNRTKIDKVNSTLTIYDNDNITPLQVFDLKDSTGAPSVTEVCERVPV